MCHVESLIYIRTYPNGLMTSGNTDLDHLPGFHIRRLQQIAVALFLEETQAHGVTPVQYAAMAAMARRPGVDQRTLASMIGLDTSTLASVIDRLEGRGWVKRSVSPADRRARLLHLTPQAEALIQAMEPDMLRAQERMLEPLPPEQRVAFMHMLRTLVEGNNDYSRAPSRADAR